MVSRRIFRDPLVLLKAQLILVTRFGNVFTSFYCLGLLVGPRKIVLHTRVCSMFIWNYVNDFSTAPILSSARPRDTDKNHGSNYYVIYCWLHKVGAALDSDRQVNTRVWYKYIEIHRRLPTNESSANYASKWKLTSCCLVADVAGVSIRYRQLHGKAIIH